MKFRMTLMVFVANELREEIDMLCEFANPIDALNAVAQLGAVHSQLRSIAQVKELCKGLPEGTLARLHERFGPWAVVVVKRVSEYRPEIPEELQRDPTMLYHAAASRLRRKIPPEGVITNISSAPAVH